MRQLAAKDTEITRLRPIAATTLVTIGGLVWLILILSRIVFEPYGFRLSWRLLSFAYATAYALLTNYSICLSRSHPASLYRLLPYAPFIFMAIGQTASSLPSIPSSYKNIELDLSLVLLNTPNLAILLTIVIWLRQAGPPNVMAYSPASASSQNELGNTKSVKDHREEDPLNEFGLGPDAHHRVTRSVVHRVASADYLARLSIAIMAILVLLGGSASIGLWLTNYAERLQAVEHE
jgi:hypothetical protein